MAYLLQILVVVISLRIKLGANKQITQLALYTMIGPKQKTKFAVDGTNINDLPASHQTDHADMAVFTTVTLVLSWVT